MEGSHLLREAHAGKQPSQPCMPAEPEGRASPTPIAPALQRLLVRTAYVCFSAIVSVVLPFFGSIGKAGRWLSLPGREC